MEEIVVGGGCFWCLDAVFRRVKGVVDVKSGYAGGEKPDPSYEEVCSGLTGHAEVVKIGYDENIISLNDILDIFFEIHDPTSLNRQGADIGSQYRSVIFYKDKKQLRQLQDKIEQIQKNFSNKIVTEVKPLERFYTAQEYHQNYFNKNLSQGYCQIVISPKVQKFVERFSSLAV